MIILHIYISPSVANNEFLVLIVQIYSTCTLGCNPIIICSEEK